MNRNKLIRHFHFIPFLTFDAVAIPDSDSLYKMINDEIDKWQPALVSWLTPQEIADALNGTRKTLPSIANMKIPKQSTDIKYPKVKYDYFS